MTSPLIIDVHMHVYKSKDEGRRAKASYEGWEFGNPTAMPAFSDYGGDVEDALAAIDEAGASRAIMVHFHLPLIGAQVEAEKSDPELNEEERLERLGNAFPTLGEDLKKSNIDACASVKDHPQILPFISIDPWALEPEEARGHLIDMVENHGARGVKLHSDSQRFMMGDKRMWPVYEACVELDVAIIAHSGRSLGRNQYSEPRAFCNCSAIMSSLTVKRKCPHEGACDIDAERADKASGSQQFDGGPYDHGAGSDFDGSERAPHQAYSGGLQKGRRSRTRSRQSRSQTGQRYIGPVGDRRGGPGADPIRGSQPHAPERVAEGARGHRHRS